MTITTSLPKKGFSIPLERWIRNDLKNDILNTIIEKPIYGEECIDIHFLANVVEDFYNQKNNNWQLIWHIYTWQKWAKTYKLI